MIGKIIGIKNETRNVKTIKFDLAFDFIPGQFVFIHADINGEKVKRAYSIASAPNENLELTIELSPGGKLTPYLHDSLKIGDSLEISEPIGKFTLNDENKIALIAGGSGVVPFMSMIRHVTKHNLDTKIVLFYSVKKFDDLIYYHELNKIHENFKNIRVIYTITRETPPEWYGKVGRLTLNSMTEELDNYKDYVFYICGPIEMVKFFSDELKPLGVKLKRELWG